MLWRRYRLIAMTSVPAAALIGVLLALLLYLGSNPDYREQGGWTAFAYLAATGGVVGALTSLPAVVGAAAALTLRDRSLKRTPSTRVRIGALGAAAGASISWIALGTVNSLLSAGGGAWLFLYVFLAAGAALVSGAAAAGLIWWAETAFLARLNVINSAIPGGARGSAGLYDKVTGRVATRREGRRTDAE